MSDQGDQGDQSGTGDDTTEIPVGSGADDTTEIDVGESSGTGGDGSSATERELQAVRAERDALKAQLDTKQQRRGFWMHTRGFLAVIGVVLSCILVAGAILGVWARNSFLETDGFVERAGSLIDEPEVQSALAGWLTEEVNNLIEPQQVIEDALPEEASVLAVPLGGAVEEFVGDQVDDVVSSDLFADLWKGAVEVAHTAAVAVLEGESELLQVQESAQEAAENVEERADTVVINLLPIINEVLAEITSASPEIFGQTVNLPDVTVEDLPDDARQAIGDAIGVDLDEDFGTFTIYDDGALSAAQQAVELVKDLVWLFVITAPLMIAATLWVSTRRRRTTLQLTVGVALTMVLLRRLVMLFQDDLLDLVQNPDNLGAVDATASTFLDPLLDGALWVGIIALVIAAIAMVTGPYGWAVSLRRGVVDFSQGTVAAVSNRSQDEETLAWVSEHRDALQIGGAVVGVLLLWVLDLSWFWFFVLAALVGAYEFGVSRFADLGKASADDDGSDADGDTDTDADPDGDVEAATAGASG